MKYWVLFGLSLYLVCGAGFAQELQREKSLKERALSEWALAGDMIAVVLTDVRRVESVGELCFDLGAAFHRMASAQGKTGLVDGFSSEKELQEEASNIRSGLAALADICTKESALDWRERLPEFETSLKSIIEIHKDFVRRLQAL